jgi:hypothetical protein
MRLFLLFIALASIVLISFFIWGDDLPAFLPMTVPLTGSENMENGHGSQLLFYSWAT